MFENALFEIRVLNAHEQKSHSLPRTGRHSWRWDFVCYIRPVGPAWETGPPGKFNLVRYHGVLAPAAGWRSQPVSLGDPPYSRGAAGFLFPGPALIPQMPRRIPSAIKTTMPYAGFVSEASPLS